VVHREAKSAHPAHCSVCTTGPVVTPTLTCRGTGRLAYLQTMAGMAYIQGYTLLLTLGGMYTPPTHPGRHIYPLRTPNMEHSSLSGILIWSILASQGLLFWSKTGRNTHPEASFLV